MEDRKIGFERSWLDVPARSIAVDFPLTLRCPCKCKWCSYSTSDDPGINSLDLTEDDVDEALRQIGWAKDNGVDIREIRILGGQPTCHHDYRGILKYAIAGIRSDFRDVEVVMMSANIASRDDLDYAESLGARLIIGDISEKNNVYHRPFPVDWDKYGARRIDACDPSDWPVCGAIAFRKIDDGGLVWAVCPNIITMAMEYGDLESIREKMSSIKAALDFGVRKELMCKYCNMCWQRFEVPMDVVRQMEEKGLRDVRSLVRAQKDGVI